MKMAKDMTRGRPFTVLLQFALPVIGGNLFQLFYTLADSVIVGRTLGAEALAAVGSTFTWYSALCRGLPAGLVFAWGSASVREMRPACGAA